MRTEPSAEVLPSLSGGPAWAAHVVHGAPVLLAYFDLEQRFRYANDTHRSWLGVEPQLLLG
jgi:hypothetical protein